MVLSAPHTEVTRAVIALCFAIALTTTSLRIFHRWRQQRLWWDDFWVIVAIVSETFVALLCIIIPIQNTKRYSVDVQILRYLGLYISVTVTRWAALVSLAVCIVRLVPDSRFRRIAKAATYLLTLFFIGLLLQKSLYCGPDWRKVIIESCKVTPITGYLDLITDIISVLWLTGAPAYMLWQMNLSIQHRVLFLLIFSSTVFVIFSSIAHVYFVITNDPSYASLTGHILLCVEIVVCNLLVLVTWLYRVIQNARESSSSGSTAMTTRRTTRCTTNPAASNEPRPPKRNLMSRIRSDPRTMFALTDIQSSSEQSCGPQFYTTFENPPSQNHTADLELHTQLPDAKHDLESQDLSSNLEHYENKKGRPD